MAAFALNGAVLGTWGTRVPAVMERHSLSEASIAGLLLLMGMGALVAFPLAGRAADSFGAAPLTRVLAVLLAAAFALLGLAPTLTLLGLAIMGLGAAYAAMDVAMNSWATEVERHIGRSVMVSFHAMWSVGAGVGAAGGYLAIELNLSYAAHFALVALFLVLLVAPLMLVPWTSRRRTEPSRSPVFVLPKGPLVLVCVVAVSATLGEGATANWSAVYLVDIVGAEQSRAALGFAIYSAAMVATRLCADAAVVRYGPASVARLSGICAFTGLVLVVGVATMPASLLGFGLMGIGYAAIIPLVFSRAASDPERSSGEAIASVALLGHGAYLLGSPTVGVIAEAYSLRLAFGILAIFALLIVLLAPVLDAGGSRSKRNA
jgi:MFS family permease